MKRPLLLLFAGLLLGPATVAAQDRWERQKGDCDQVLRGWRTQSFDRLRDCVMTWEMYRDVRSVDSDWKAIVHDAFNRVYQEGEKRDAQMALSALKRLGLRPKALRDEVKPRDQTPERRAPVVDRRPEPVEEPPPEPAAADPYEAKKAYSRGVRLVQGGDIPAALSEFLISADTDPLYPQPLYRAAQCYMRLNKPDQALDALHRMKGIASESALQLIERAKTDNSFARLRGTPGFKDLTGLAVVQILNGGGDPGQKTVEEYRSTLEENGVPVRSVAADRNPRENTYIYTKPGFERQGENIRRLLKLGLVHTRTIDWPTEYDVILIHGERGGSKWVDDEAEKSLKQAAADKKKAEDAKKAKEAADKAKAKADMKKKMEMLQMMQDLEKEDAAGAGPQSGDEAIEAVP